MPLTLSRPLVFFDLETTGTDIAKDRIVEISLVKLPPFIYAKVETIDLGIHKLISVGKYEYFKLQ